MTTKAIEPPVRVHGSFHRSVQLERDWADSNAISSYVLTPTVRDLSHRMVDGLFTPGGVRAWSVTGPYGTGKSSFILFLSQLLAAEVHQHPEGQELREQLGVTGRVLPVLLVGQREPLRPALLNALERAAKATLPSIAKRARDIRSQASMPDASVAALYSEAASAALNCGYSGLVLAIDEFGKYLEYVSAHSGHEDLLVMQQMAETAARSEAPFMVTTVLHTSMSAYMSGDNFVQRAEWQKVQGRFTDVAFREPAEQMIALVGKAIETRFTSQQRQGYEELLEQVASADELAEARQRLPVRKLAADCLPLDPLTSLILAPLFRSKLAQNERSLFSFLTSSEPYGFQDFLRRQVWHEGDLPMYRLPDLYDYVRAALGSFAFAGDLGRRWAEVEHALERIGSDAPALSFEAVKAIALLWMYGKEVGLRASRSTLELALGDPGLVADALEYLEQKSIVVYRRFEGAYALWAGSDVDLNERFATALSHVGRGSLAERLERVIELEPFVARAHYVRTGTLRYFDVAVVDTSTTDLSEALRTAHRQGDGRIVYVLTPDVESRESVVEEAGRLTRDRSLDLQVVAVPKPLVGLEDALKEFEAWRWVRANTPQIEGDPAARKELQSLLRLSLLRLQSTAGKVLGLRGYRFEPDQSEWIFDGYKHELNSTRQFLVWLSHLCDKVFSKAPEFHNELLNREQPSSAANTALYKLLRNMASHYEKPRLGLEGNPAEASMYESLVSSGGFHDADGSGRWQLQGPNANWQPVWQEIQAFLASTRSGRRPVVELYERLSQAPYGLRRGPMPVLLLVALIAKRTTVALYQDGLFQPSVTEQVAEQLARNPQGFEVQEFVVDEETQALLHSIAGAVDAFTANSDGADDMPLLRIARPLILFAARLPRYTKRTARIAPPEAIELRDALTKATDPYELLLSDLPRILDADVSSNTGREMLVARLEEALGALQRAYPRLLDQIEAQVKEALGLSGRTAQALQDELRERARPLLELAADPTLRAFLTRAVQRRDTEDWREAIGLAVVKGRAPKDWTDGDQATFQANLQLIAADFARLEEVAVEKDRSRARRVLRISLHGPDGQEARQLLGLDDQTDATATRVANALRNALRRELVGVEHSTEKPATIAALSQLVLEHLHGGDEEGAQ